jgi:hypothetical protein
MNNRAQLRTGGGYTRRASPLLVMHTESRPRKTSKRRRRPPRHTPATSSLLADWAAFSDSTVVAPTLDRRFNDKPAGRREPAEPAPYCAQCGRQFGSENALRSHLKDSPKHKSRPAPGPVKTHSKKAKRKRHLAAGGLIPTGDWRPRPTVDPDAGRGKGSSKHMAYSA